MPKKMFKCEKCLQYTLSKDICPKCGGKVKTPHPPKFSLVDKYQKYRIPLFKKKFNF
ncbi:MAG: RNA-protein complex protein Nop10 [Promethearchaeota archaeon]